MPSPYKSIEATRRGKRLIAPDSVAPAGPRGTSSQIQSWSRAVQKTRIARQYGSISAMIVHGPALSTKRLTWAESRFFPRALTEGTSFLRSADRCKLDRTSK